MTWSQKPKTAAAGSLILFFMAGNSNKARYFLGRPFRLECDRERSRRRNASYVSVGEARALAPARGPHNPPWRRLRAASRPFKAEWSTPFEAHGRDLFRVRSWALRASSLFALAGLAVATELIANRAARLAALAVSLVPILVTAPGERAATLAAARGADRRRSTIWWRLRTGPCRTRPSWSHGGCSSSSQACSCSRSEHGSASA
jgi:hypothetical protein